jgi:hypothetical protein
MLMFGRRYSSVWARAPMGPDRLVPWGSHAAPDKVTAELGQEVVEHVEEVFETAEVACAGAPVASSEGAKAEEESPTWVLVPEHQPQHPGC